VHAADAGLGYLGDVRFVTGDRVGLIHLDGRVDGPEASETVRFLVDSGASYTLVPFEVWRRVGLSTKRTMAFTLADGTELHRSIGECHIELMEGEGHTPVILGEPGDEALLGMVTLENLGLVLNPFTRQLQPMRALLA
jgi:clan AA aspartic protease